MGTASTARGQRARKEILKNGCACAAKAVIMSAMERTNPAFPRFHDPRPACIDCGETVSDGSACARCGELLCPECGVDDGPERALCDGCDEGICHRCNGEGCLTLWGTPRPDVDCGECGGKGVRS